MRPAEQSPNRNSAINQGRAETIQSPNTSVIGGCFPINKMHRFKQQVAGESSEIRVPGKWHQICPNKGPQISARSNRTFQSGCFPLKKMHRFKQHVAGESSEIRVPGKWPQICPKKGPQISAQLVAIKSARSNNEGQPRLQWSCQANCNSA